MLEHVPEPSSPYHFLNTYFDLWVFPMPRQSSWFARMDWYLNWQMCRGLSYEGFKLPAETYRVASEFGVNVPRALDISDSPLLVRGEGLVPADACVVVNGSEGSELSEWLRKVERVAADLKAKKILVFLPLNANPEEAQNCWRKLATSCVAEFAPDLQGDVA